MLGFDASCMLNIERSETTQGLKIGSNHALVCSLEAPSAYTYLKTLFSFNAGMHVEWQQQQSWRVGESEEVTRRVAGPSNMVQAPSSQACKPRQQNQTLTKYTRCSNKSFDSAQNVNVLPSHLPQKCLVYILRSKSRQNVTPGLYHKSASRHRAASSSQEIV